MAKYRSLNYQESRYNKDIVEARRAKEIKHKKDYNKYIEMIVIGYITKARVASVRSKHTKEFTMKEIKELADLYIEDVINEIEHDIQKKKFELQDEFVWSKEYNKYVYAIIKEVI